MKYTLVLSLAVAAVVAMPQSPVTEPKGEALPKCQKTTDIKPLADPLQQFKPKSANFPCDMGSPIPFGPVPKGCAKFEVIVARGTSEPGDFGSMVGDPLVARIKRDMPGVNVRGYPVQYPADAGGLKFSPGGTLSLPKPGTSLAALSPTGPNDIVYRIGNQTKECPDERFALVGYSQGGGVVYRAATLLKEKPELADKVLAVVIYGSSDGSQVALPHKIVLANCARGDIACPEDGKNPGTPLGHVSYNDEGTKWHDRSAEFIKSAFNGKPLGPKLVKTADETL